MKEVFQLFKIIFTWASVLLSKVVHCFSEEEEEEEEVKIKKSQFFGWSLVDRLHREDFSLTISVFYIQFHSNNTETD